MEKLSNPLWEQYPNKYWDINDYSRLVTPRQNIHLPVYRWYSFKHSFSRNLVHNIIKGLKVSGDDLVLDPFCGAGTTILACKELGINGIGLDLMPLSVFITNTKIGSFDKDEVKYYLSHLPTPKESAQVPDYYEENLAKYFPKINLTEATYLNYYIEGISHQPTRDLFKLALFSILEEISYSRKDGAFIRIIKDKRPKETFRAFKEKITMFLSDLDFLNSLPKVHSYASIGDARKTKLENGSISAVITSPPYPNRHDYTRIYFLELMFGFYRNSDEIKSLRYELLRSHVEAREKYKAFNYVKPEELATIIEKLKCADLPNRNVINLVESYFKDMHIFLREMMRVLTNEGTVSLVIGDSRYGGINVPAGEIIIDIAKKIGFDLTRNIVARDKGNSPQQMGRYGKSLSKESVITLKKS